MATCLAGYVLLTPRGLQSRPTPRRCVKRGLREQYASRLHSTFGQAAHVRGRVKRKTVPSLLVPPPPVLP